VGAVDSPQATLIPLDHLRSLGLEPGWFGGPLEGDVRARYVAVGYMPVPDRGLDEGRAYVVDIRTGHVIWQRPIEHRAELPRTITALGA